MSVREELLDAIAAAVGPDVHVIPYQDSTDVLDRRTIMFKQLSMQPLEAAPRGAYRVNYVLTFVTPHTDPGKGEADLDAFVPAILGDLDALDWFAWSTADKVLGPGGQGLAYDVSAWIVGNKVPTAPTPARRSRKGQADHG
jgi:hypothetical protein